MAAVDRCQGAPPTQADVGHRNRATKADSLSRNFNVTKFNISRCSAMVARLLWEHDRRHSGLFPETSNIPLTLRIFGLWDFRKNRQKWQRPHSIPQTLKIPQKLNIGMWRSLVSRLIWVQEISQVRILSSRPPFLRSLAVSEDFFFFLCLLRLKS